MRKWVFLLIFLVGLGFYGVYEYGALKYYFKAMRGINQLNDQEKSRVLEEYIDSSDSQLDLYKGILMKVSLKKKGGIWVWGQKGPRYFKSDEHSVYSYFSICKPVILEKFKKGEEVMIGKTLSANIIDWNKKVKRGDYIVIVIANKNQGGTLGNLREAMVYDWWGFLPSYNVEEECLKR